MCITVLLGIIVVCLWFRTLPVDDLFSHVMNFSMFDIARDITPSFLPHSSIIPPSFLPHSSLIPPQSCHIGDGLDGLGDPGGLDGARHSLQVQG